MEPIRLRASEESKNQRLDAFLASSLDGLTRSQATRLIESGEVAVNGRAVSKSYKLAGGEDIAVTLPEPEPAVDPAAEQNPGFPPDDSALRAQLDMSAVLAAGTPIGFEQASCLRESDGAVYYVYNSDEKTELPQDKVLVTAV